MSESAERLSTFGSAPDEDPTELRDAAKILNFPTGKLFSKHTKQKIPRKSIGMDVAFQKVLLETKRSKLARVFALPG